MKSVAGLISIVLLFASSLALAQGPLPSIQITNLGTPNGGCTTPGTMATVFMNGTAANSDNYTISVNGVLQSTWTNGETMSAAPPSPPGGPHWYGFNYNATPGAFAANSTVTATVITYAGANASSPYTAGQTPVYRSSISWNCTTGEQVGEIVNVDLRTSVAPVPSSSFYSLLAGTLCLLALGAFTLRQRCHLEP